jgi:hypothetical protein
MVVRTVRNRVNNASLSAAQARLKAAINNSLAAYMKNAASPANLAKVNNATKNLIKVYVENVAAANVKPPNGNGGNKPLLLANSNKPSNNGVKKNNIPVALNGNGGNNGNPLGVGNLANNGMASSGKSKYNGIKAKLNTMKEPNAQTYLSLNALKRAVKSNANSNAKEAMLQKINNKKANLDTVRASRNVTASAIAAAKNKAAANAAEAERAAQAAKNAKNAEAAANAERKAREAANKAAANAREANEAAKKIAASAIASAIEKQKAANAKAAANNAAREAAAAASKAAEIKSKWQRAGQGVGKAVQAGNAFSAVGANSRRQKLLNEAKRKEAMNAAHAKLMGRINSASTSGQLNTIVSNIARNGKNFNAQKRMNLQSKVKDKRRQIAIQQKKNDGQGVRAGRALARATRSNNALASANLNRGKLMNRYSRYREEINAAPTNAELNRLVTVLGGVTGRLFSENEKKNARAAINRKRNSLKGPGPSPNAPKNGGPNNNMSKLSLSQLNAIIRLTKARLNKGQGANGNKNRLARATKLANALRPKKKGLFGHIGGAIGAVGGAAVGGVKAAGGAAKYVAAGTVHHASKGAKFGLGVVASGVGRMGQSHMFNVTVGRKKIPNTPLNNGNKKPGKLARAVQKNENIAAARKAYQQSVGGNASENAMSAAGALGSLAIAGGAHTAARAAAALKRASNINKAVKAGKFTAKTLKHAPRIR